MPLSEARRKAIAKYDAKTYKRTTVKRKINEFEEMKAHAAAMGESLNMFINRAITAQIERDNAESSAM